MQQPLGVAVAQESGTGAFAGAEARTTATSNLGAVDDAMSLGLTGERRPPYFLQPSDVVDVGFTFTPEFNQTVTVQPDGNITLKAAGQLNVEGQTVEQVRAAVRQRYERFLQDPEVTVTLKDFQRPYFVAAGEVKHPGKYELRADTTLSQAVAISGGFTSQARDSRVLLFRRVNGQWSEPRLIDVKKLMAKGGLREDLELRAGDLVFVPQNTIAKIRKYVPPLNMGLYANPTQF
jgi:polysaccharide biosynthesis/export protein